MRPYFDPPLPRSRAFTAICSCGTPKTSRGGGQQFAETATHVVLGNGGRRGVFLHVQERSGLPALFHVNVDGRRVLGQVRVVGAVAGDALARAPGLELLEVLAQAVGDHLRTVRQRLGLARFAGGRGDRIADDQRASMAPLNSWYFLAARKPVA